jgi:hypothetical protein
MGERGVGPLVLTLGNLLAKTLQMARLRTGGQVMKDRLLEARNEGQSMGSGLVF